MTNLFPNPAIFNFMFMTFSSKKLMNQMIDEPASFFLEEKLIKIIDEVGSLFLEEDLVATNSLLTSKIY